MKKNDSASERLLRNNLLRRGMKRFLLTASTCVLAAVFVLVAIVKKRLALKHSLYTILQILSTTLFEKMPVPLVFQRYDEETQISNDSKQLMLFDI